MAIGDDFSVAANGDIRHTSGTATYTVIEFHRWLGDLADDAVSAGNDILDITNTTPSDRSTDNIIKLNDYSASSGRVYNIDDTAAQYLYDGSIEQKNGAELYSGLVVVGSVVAGTELQIVQNNALLTSYWGTGLNADAGANILLRIMVKTRTASADIDGKRLRVQARELGDTYSEFSLTAGLGNSTAAIFTGTDLNNGTAAGTISGWADVTNTEGYQLLDISGDGSADEPYYSQWDRGTRTINQLYERTKWLQRRGTSETLYGLNGELFRGITHQVAVSGGAGTTITQNEVVSWGSGATAGTGAVLAADNMTLTSTTKIWIQLLTGVTPTGTITFGNGTATAGAITSRSISPAFIGQSTGSAIIGAYGVGFNDTPGDTLTTNDQVFDLNNAPHNPPNNVTFTVEGLISGEDRVLVGPENGSGGLQTIQFTGATGQNANGASTWVVNEAIPGDTPSSGTVRVFNGTNYDRVPYTSWTGSTFTLTGTLPSDGASHTFAFDGAAGTDPYFQVGEIVTFGGGGTAEVLVVSNTGTDGEMTVRMLTGADPIDNDSITGGTSTDTANVDGVTKLIEVGGFISYIDLLAAGTSATFTGVFQSPRTLFIRVRDGGTAGDTTPIKTFETTGTLGAAGGTTTAIRNSDA